MMKILSKNRKTVFFIITVLFIFVVSLIFIIGVYQKTLAGTYIPVYGWAWSDTIGWISFNCETDPNTDCLTESDYKTEIRYDMDRFQGYAWSDNVGWIKLYPESGFPSGQGSQWGSRLTDPDVDSLVTGWAWACAGSVNGDCSGGDRTDGWDGWIRMDHGFNNGVSWDPSTGDFSGFAWGGEVVGWISFNVKNCDLDGNGEYGDAGAPAGCPTKGTAYDYKVYTGPVCLPVTTPTNFNATNNCGIINLTWDDATNEKNYDVERKLVGGSYSDVIIGLPADAVSALDDAPDGSTYVYRVEARNSCPSSKYSNESTVTASACADFTLNSSNAILATIVIDGGPVDSSETTITVNPTGGFLNPVTLSSDADIVIPGATGVFSDLILDDTEYAIGSVFYVTGIPEATAEGVYNITITGDDGSISRTVVVPLNIGKVDPEFKEI